MMHRAKFRTAIRGLKRGVRGGPGGQSQKSAVPERQGERSLKSVKIHEGSGVQGQKPAPAEGRKWVARPQNAARQEAQAVSSARKDATAVVVASKVAHEPKARLRVLENPRALRHYVRVIEPSLGNCALERIIKSLTIGQRLWAETDVSPSMETYAGALAYCHEYEVPTVVYDAGSLLYCFGADQNSEAILFVPYGESVFATAIRGLRRGKHIGAAAAQALLTSFSDLEESAPGEAKPPARVNGEETDKPEEPRAQEDAVGDGVDPETDAIFLDLLDHCDGCSAWARYDAEEEEQASWDCLMEKHQLMMEQERCWLGIGRCMQVSSRIALGKEEERARAQLMKDEWGELLPLLKSPVPVLPDRVVGVAVPPLSMQEAADSVSWEQPQRKDDEWHPTLLRRSEGGLAGLVDDFKAAWDSAFGVTMCELRPEVLLGRELKAEDLLYVRLTDQKDMRMQVDGSYCPGALLGFEAEASWREKVTLTLVKITERKLYWEGPVLRLYERYDEAPAGALQYEIFRLCVSGADTPSSFTLTRALHRTRPVRLPKVAEIVAPDRDTRVRLMYHLVASHAPEKLQGLVHLARSAEFGLERRSGVEPADQLASLMRVEKLLEEVLPGPEFQVN